MYAPHYFFTSLYLHHYIIVYCLTFTRLTLLSLIMVHNKFKFLENLIQPPLELSIWTTSGISA